ncbi:hypothetical protein CEXT_362091 [Caerostris extrusa]|uniref:Uncharacterized protein n=1 Tax=Caerostris extrusa TaxID=172846 RepID=A0AAV4N4G1_CAEEX|nr:hypothetical protein CEXT_362091 [Caerostris extrusa]
MNNQIRIFQTIPNHLLPSLSHSTPSLTFLNHQTIVEENFSNFSITLPPLEALLGCNHQNGANQNRLLTSSTRSRHQVIVCKLPKNTEAAIGALHPLPAF